MNLARTLSSTLTFFAVVFALCITSSAFGKSAAGLALSADKVADGYVQTLLLNLDDAELPTVVDVYILLTGPAGSLRSLKADGTFGAPRMISPRLRGEKVAALKASSELVTLRLTGLPVGAHKWTVALVKHGSRFGTDTTTFSADFVVQKPDGPLFAELAEGRDGGAVDATKRRSASAFKSESRARGGAIDSLSSRLAEPSAPAAPSVTAAPMIASPTPARSAGSVRFSTADPSGAPAAKSAPDFFDYSSAPKPLSRPSSAAKKMPATTKPSTRRIPAKGKLSGLAAADGDADAPADRAVPEALLRERGIMKGKPALEALEIADADEEADEEGLRKLGAAELKKAEADIEKAKTLTAGATDDNKEFGDFLTFLKDRNSPAVMCQDIAQRRFITVLDSKGRHVSNADVAIKKDDKLLFAGRTLANGQTLFCPAAVPELNAGKHRLDIEVAKGLVSRSWSVEIDVATDEKLKNKFDPKQMPEQPMPIDIMPLPGCGVGLKPMARVAAPAALRALEAEPVAITADAIGLLGADFAAAFKAARPHVDGASDRKTDGKTDGKTGTLAATFDAVPGLAPEREKTVPKGDWVLRLPGKLPVEAPKIDLVFQIDTTGSMRDEIRAVQATLQSVAKRIDSMDPKPTVRWGLVLYGDRGDTYVVRRYNFTPDVNELHEWVLNMAMTGGGDTPESALEALHASVNEMAWDSGDAIRLVFLIADAPPHLDYSRPYTYVDKMKEAVAKGIKIIPTAASGLDKTGEYIFRQWAQGTMGKFLYITYGAGGAGGKAGTTDHEVKQPKKKNNLDDLIVQAVADELANWRSPTLYDSGEKKIEQPKFTVRKAE